MNRQIVGIGLLVALVAMGLYACLVPLGTTRLDYKAGLADLDPIADPRVDCGDDHFEQTTSMWRLPIGMRDILGGAGMSGPGGPFNPGDVGDGPRRRFATAAIAGAISWLPSNRAASATASRSGPSNAMALSIGSAIACQD